MKLGNRGITAEATHENDIFVLFLKQKYLQTLELPYLQEAHECQDLHRELETPAYSQKKCECWDLYIQASILVAWALMMCSCNLIWAVAKKNAVGKTKNCWSEPSN